MKSESLPSYPRNCPPSKENECHAIIDLLLQAAKPQQAEVINLLLDVKFALIQRENAEELLGLFFALRQELENTHYLPLYRFRRCLEQSIRVAVSGVRGYPEQIFPLKLSTVNDLNELTNIYKAKGGKTFAFGNRLFLQPRVNFRLKEV